MSNQPKEDDHDDHDHDHHDHHNHSQDPHHNHDHEHGEGCGCDDSFEPSTAEEHQMQLEFMAYLREQYPQEELQNDEDSVRQEKISKILEQFQAIKQEQEKQTAILQEKVNIIQSRFPVECRDEFKPMFDVNTWKNNLVTETKAGFDQVNASMVDPSQGLYLPPIVEITQHVYRVKMYNDDFLKQISDFVKYAEEWLETNDFDLIPPNSMNRYGLSLEHLGLGPLFVELTQYIFQSIVPHHYPFVLALMGEDEEEEETTTGCGCSNGKECTCTNCQCVDCKCPGDKKTAPMASGCCGTQAAPKTQTASCCGPQTTTTTTTSPTCGCDNGKQCTCVDCKCVDCKCDAKAKKSAGCHGVQATSTNCGCDSGKPCICTNCQCVHCKCDENAAQTTGCHGVQATSTNCGCGSGKPCTCTNCQCVDCKCDEKTTAKASSCCGTQTTTTTTTTNCGCDSGKKCTCTNCQCVDCKCDKQTTSGCHGLQATSTTIGCRSGKQCTCTNCQCVDCKCDKGVKAIDQSKFPTIFDNVHTFTVQYRLSEEKDAAIKTPLSHKNVSQLHLHTDASHLTLNLCLGGEFTEGKLFLKGHRCMQHQQIEINPETSPFTPKQLEETSESVSLPQIPGSAYIHSGTLRHGAEPITQGFRQNLIIWAVSNKLRRNFNGMYFGPCFVCAMDAVEGHDHEHNDDGSCCATSSNVVAEATESTTETTEAQQDDKSV